MKLLTLAIVATMTAMPALAESVTFVIPGGTKGVYMSLAVSYTEDLAAMNYTTDIGAPGNTCGAAELVNSNAHPTLFIWGSDSEAGARMGNGCPAPQFSAEEVIAVGYTPVFVCTANPEIEPLSGEHKVGVWLANEAVHASAINQLNTVAGSNLTPIPYDGSGSVLTALTNGEIDVALLPLSRAKTVKESGGACKYMFAAADQSADAVSLPEVYNSPALNLTAMDIIVAKNWEINEAKSVLEKIYSDTASSVSQNTTKFNNNVPDNVMDLWTSSIAAFVIK